MISTLSVDQPLLAGPFGRRENAWSFQHIWDLTVWFLWSSETRKRRSASRCSGAFSRARVVHNHECNLLS